MISLKDSNTLIDFFPVSLSKGKAAKKYLYWFCTFFLLIAVLELGQDYIGSLLNGNQFQLFTSLSYKTFWLLFIPFSLIMSYGFEKVGMNLSGTSYFACNMFLVLVITIIHLITFSIFLFGISYLFQTDPWQLSKLVTEKFSTRLYIALSIYTVLSTVYFLSKRQESKQREYSKTITVKHGQTSVIVNIEDIRWIGSDGHYLNIHTLDKKHVVVNSLKKMVTILPDNFKRIHRSTIVNIEIISELKSRLNGDYDVVLNDGNVLRLSRNYTDSLKGVLL